MVEPYILYLGMYNFLFSQGTSIRMYAFYRSVRTDVHANPTIIILRLEIMLLSLTAAHSHLSLKTLNKIATK